MMTFVDRQIVAVDFPNIPWTTWKKPGAEGRGKLLHTQGKRFRILELPPGFDEESWCDRGHDGYVIEGEFMTIFEDGGTASCKPGMAFCIPDGVAHRSKGSTTSKTVVVVVDEENK